VLVQTGTYYVPETTIDQDAPASARSSILSSGHLGSFNRIIGLISGLLSC